MHQALRVSPLSFVSCLVSWVGISALLMSPALAQVNGSGPSPSNLFDVVLNLPGDEAVVTGGYYESIGGVSGQTTQLNVNDSGNVGAFFVAESGSEVNISGGYVGVRSEAHSGSEVNISSGTVGFGFSAFAGSVVNIIGGALSEVDVLSGSVVNIGGGTVGSVDAKSGSEVNISGGTVGRIFNADSGSDVELIGGEFRLNGADFSGSTISLADDDVFTGTLADGSSFIFRDADSSDLSNVTLTAAALPAADLIPILINAPVVSGPSGLRADQTLTLQAGGSLRDNFAVVDATLNVEGGTVGGAAEASSSVVNISGGTVGNGFDALASEVNISGGRVGSGFNASDSSVVNISGGNVSRSFDASDGSVVNISGGALSTVDALSGSVVNISGGTVLSVGANSGSEVNISGGTVSSVGANSGSEVNISGGTVSRFIDANDGSVVNISGGAVSTVDASDGSVINISGSAFLIDGEKPDSLVLGEAFTITDRDVTLSGLLADGEQFSFQLGSVVSSNGNEFFSPNATLTVTLVSPVILGDVNLDGVVDFLDISAFIGILSTGGFQAEADIDQNDVVNFLDIAPFIGLLSGN